MLDGVLSLLLLQKKNIIIIRNNESVGVFSRSDIISFLLTQNNTMTFMSYVRGVLTYSAGHVLHQSAGHIISFTRLLLCRVKIHEEFDLFSSLSFS